MFNIYSLVFLLYIEANTLSPSWPPASNQCNRRDCKNNNTPPTSFKSIMATSRENEKISKILTHRWGNIQSMDM